MTHLSNPINTNFGIQRKMEKPDENDGAMV
jgi:hypothetical protein